jgi:hypothetical protein
MNVNQQKLINFSIVIISSCAKLLFAEEPQVTLIAAEGKTEIAQTIISV